MTTDQDVANWELFVWALSLLGGSTEFKDVEDVFIRCFELAPKRFSWRSHKEIPDYKKCSKALQEAETRRPPFFVKTRDGYKRQLTVEGQKWIRENENRMQAIAHGGTTIREPRTRPNARMLAEVERSTVYVQWEKEGVLPNEKWKYAEILRCSPDSERQIWESRLQILRAAANDAERNRLLKFFSVGNFDIM